MAVGFYNGPSTQPRSLPAPPGDVMNKVPLFASMPCPSCKGLHDLYVPDSEADRVSCVAVYLFTCPETETETRIVPNIAYDLDRRPGPDAVPMNRVGLDR